MKQGQLLIELARKKNLEGIKVLEKHNNDIKQKDENGQNIFHIFSGDGFLKGVKYCVDNGFKIDEPDKLGNTALHYATLLGQYSVVNYLLEQGASPEIRNNDNLTPAEFAKNTKVVLPGLNNQKKIMIADRLNETNHHLIRKKSVVNPNKMSSTGVFTAGFDSVIVGAKQKIKNVSQGSSLRNSVRQNYVNLPVSKNSNHTQTTLIRYWCTPVGQKDLVSGLWRLKLDRYLMARLFLINVIKDNFSNKSFSDKEKVNHIANILLSTVKMLGIFKKPGKELDGFLHQCQEMLKRLLGSEHLNYKIGNHELGKTMENEGYQVATYASLTTISSESERWRQQLLALFCVIKLDRYLAEKSKSSSYLEACVFAKDLRKAILNGKEAPFLSAAADSTLKEVFTQYAEIAASEPPKLNLKPIFRRSPKKIRPHSERLFLNGGRKKEKMNNRSTTVYSENEKKEQKPVKPLRPRSKRITVQDFSFLNRGKENNLEKPTLKKRQRSEAILHRNMPMNLTKKKNFLGAARLKSQPKENKWKVYKPQGEQPTGLKCS